MEEQHPHGQGHSSDEPAEAGALYKIFVLFILFVGGYVLMRFGMEIEPRIAALIAFGAMPLATLLLWLLGYKGKRFK